MTRVNVGIDPRLLSRQHLIAEHREIKRIPNLVKNKRVDFEKIPSEFKLGTGHVRFFYNKLGYLLKRYEAIRNECLNRGFNVEDYSSAWNGVPPTLMNDYTPTAHDTAIIKQRIKEKTKV